MANASDENSAAKQDDLDPRFVDYIVRVTKRFGKAQMSGAWTLIPRGQFFILRVIDAKCDEDGGVPVSTIAEVMHSSKPGISRALGALESQGLITRSPAPADRRSTIVSLTEEGHRLHDDMYRLFREYITLVVGTYGEEKTRRLMEEMAAYTEAMDGALETMHERYPDLETSMPPHPPFCGRPGHGREHHPHSNIDGRE